MRGTSPCTIALKHVEKSYEHQQSYLVQSSQRQVESVQC